MVKVTALDHVVLKVADVRRSIAWYRDLLGLETLRLEEWERGEVLFPSLRIDATTIIDVFEAERSGVNVDHLCFVVDADELDAVVASGAFEVVSPPADLFGARGVGRGFYTRDPDGNLIELRTYG